MEIKNISASGLSFLINEEGLRLKPYLDLVGIATIGVGCTYYENGAKVKITDKAISKERAEQLSKESQTLQAKIIYNESQLRIEQATQNNLAKQLTTAQDENMKLKQDVELYKNMLSQRSKSPQ